MVFVNYVYLWMSIVRTMLAYKCQMFTLCMPINVKCLHHLCRKTVHWIVIHPNDLAKCTLDACCFSQIKIMTEILATDSQQEVIAYIIHEAYIDGLMQDCSNSIANTLELLQSCTKPSTYINIRLIEHFVIKWSWNAWKQLNIEWI